MSRGEMVGDWSETGGFLGAILAGLLLGFLGDRLFGTEPVLVVLGIVAGFSVGFWRMYQIARKTEEDEMLRRSQRPTP